MKFSIFTGLSIGVTLAASCFMLDAGFLNCLVAAALLNLIYCFISILLCCFAYSADTRSFLRGGNAMVGGFMSGFLGLHMVLSGADKLSLQYSIPFSLSAVAVFIFAALWLVTSVRLLTSLRSYEGGERPIFRASW